MADDVNTNHATPAAPRPRRRGRWVLGIVAGVIVAILVLVAIVPTLLSTGPGTRWVANLISGSIAGSVTIADASFGWFGGQSLNDVTLRDPQDDIVAQITRIEAPDVALLPVAFGSRDLGAVRVAIAQATIRQPVDGPSNLQRAIELTPPPDPDAPTEIGEMSATLNLTADRITYESPGVEPVELTDVQATAAVPDPRQITLQLSSGLRQGGATGRLAADMAINDAFDAAGVMQLEQAKLDGRAEAENLPIAMIDRLAQQDGLLVALLGEQLTAEVATTGGVEDLNAVVVARSDRLTIDTRLARTERGLEAQGGAIRLQMTPEAFARLAEPAGEPARVEPDQGGPTRPDSQAAPRLVEPFTLAVDLRELLLPTTPEGVAPLAAQFDASVSADAIVLDVPEQGRVAVRDLVLALASPNLSERLSADLTAQAALAEASGPVRATATVTNLLAEERPLSAAVQTERLPVALVDAATGLGGSLVQTLGETLDANVEITQGNDGALAFAGEVRTPNVAGPFTGAYGPDGAFSLTTPEPIALTVTPETYRTWVPGAESAEQGWTLAAPASLRVNLEEFTYAATDADRPDEASDQAAPLQIDPERTRIVGRLGIESAAFTNPQTQERVGITGGTIDIDGRNLREVLRIVANLQLEPQTAPDPNVISRDPDDAASGGGSIESETELRGLFSAAGELQPAEAQVLSQTRLQGVPSGLIDSLAGQGGELAAVLGPVTSLSADVRYEPGGGGATDVTLDTSNVQGTIPARITETGTVELREDAALAVHVTPEVSRVLLSKMTPMLASAVSADVPLRLRVAAEGFAVPLEGFDWRRVSGNAVLDAGQLTLAPQGFTGLVLNTVQQFARLPLEQGRYQASLRSLPFSIDQGRLRYDNLTLGLAGVTFDFGGMVDLAAQRFDLGMTLGGEALPRELRGVTVPIEGPFAEPLSRETLVRAMAGAAIGVGLREGLGELLNDQRDERPTQEQAPQEGRPQEGQPQTEPERPRDPLQQLLEIGRQRLEAEQRRREQGESNGEGEQQQGEE